MNYFQTNSGYIVDENNELVPMEEGHPLYIAYLAFLKQGGAVEPTDFEIEVIEPKTLIELIRERYSIDDELSIQRQRENKPDEFIEYYAFVENCKTLIN